MVCMVKCHFKIIAPCHLNPPNRLSQVQQTLGRNQIATQASRDGHDWVICRR